MQIIGDDYLVTNPSLVRQASEFGACNAVLVKVNQVGTVSEALEAFFAAEKAGWRGVVSARSGETEVWGHAHREDLRTSGREGKADGVPQ